MGRSYKNRRRQEKHGKDGTSTDRWKPSTKAELLNYLIEYRLGCTVFYYTQHAEHLKRHILSNEDDFKSLVSPQISSHSPENQVSLTVSGIPFPILCEKVFQQPYMLLPTHLTSKQRRFMHHCCIEANLFHDSVTDRLECRRMVISCYADGFEYLDLPRLKNEPVITSLYSYKPWYCRHHNNQKMETQAMKDAIWEYIDQPGLCLRDERDHLEYDSCDSSLHQFVNLFDCDVPNSSDLIQVNTAAQMRQCIQELSVPSVREIGFDLESFQVNANAQITCVLQLTSNLEKDYIIDTLADGVWEEVQGLRPLFSDPCVVKIGHAIGGLDVQSLHRDFGIYIVNAFDTYEAAKLLPIQQHNLAGLCHYYNMPNSSTHQKFKELYQNCDWRTRPMSSEMIQYARADVHCLLNLRKFLVRDLVLVNNPYIWDDPNAEAKNDRIHSNTDVSPSPDVLDFISRIADMEDDQTTASFTTATQSMHTTNTQKLDKFLTPSNSSILDATDDDDDGILPSNGPRTISSAELRYQPLLMTCISLSQERCLKVWTKDPNEESFLKHDLFLSLTRELGDNFTSVDVPSSELMEKLVEWRNRRANEMECFPSFLVPMDFLIYVAWKQPLTEAGLRLISQELPPWLEHSTEGRRSLLDAVLQYRLNESPSPISTATIYYYSNIMNHHDRNFTDEATVEWYSGENIIKVIVAGSLTVGIFVAIFDAIKNIFRRR